MKKPNSNNEEITPEALFNNRRVFLKTSIYATTGLATAGVYRFFRGGSAAPLELSPANKKFLGKEATTTFKDITNYNNFYEFTTNKEGVADAAKNWKITNWDLEISGLVENPIKLNLEDIRKIKTEERIYRFRCVEGWSMVIPWQGFSLQSLLLKAKPLANAKYVSFVSYYDEKDMPNALDSGIAFPYVEGLRLDEALHPLTFMATGLYGKDLTNQNGAAIRLVVPWKYGFKSIKSVVKIILTDKEPPTTWNLANPREYGFYSNVNPAVEHPRWSQAQERRIGELGLIPTLPFNGYADEVAELYRGMDLRKYF
jgi:sulfoxide reductase catalytic subunit YedY